MRFFGDDRDTLIRSRVRLVQSGHFKRNVDDMDEKTINGLDDIVELDYMGFSEFECGALPKSLRRMTINKDFYKVFVFDQYKDENGNTLKVYAPIFYENMQDIVDRLVNRRHEIDREDTFKDDKNFWWDIENDFFVFFDHTDKVLQAMDALKERKFGYENEKNGAREAFNKLGMLLLKKPDVIRLRGWNTSMKDYFYNKNDEVHFIEFFEGATLQNIFMEAMIIAKVDKGTVKFNINGIPFSIDEDSTLDNIISENEINLTDHCLYSEKIDGLISQYNEDVQKKEIQKQLVHVLQLVSNKKNN